jgi:hypothetical protein
MRATCLVSLALVALVSMRPLLASDDGQAQQKPTVQVPKPGVPEIMTLEGTFVRAAYNNEGYAIIGYELANRSIGEKWMLIEFGATVRDGVPSFRLTRTALSLETPDGKTILLATESEYRQGDVRSLLMRERVQRESINYFPPSARQACRIGFFAELESRAMMYDDVELSSTRGCVGRLFFQVPSGIAYGQHWLNVKFQKSVVRVPFRILTKDEEKLLSKNFNTIRRQVQDAFKKN